jgi:hypothetical protein
MNLPHPATTESPTSSSSGLGRMGVEVVENDVLVGDTGYDVSSRGSSREWVSIPESQTMYGEPRSPAFSDATFGVNVASVNESTRAPQRPRSAKAVKIDVDDDLYPYCIVWTVIPGCTWCFPFVGHMGIGDSSGQVWEFMGGGVTRAPPGGLSFGPVVRYVKLNPKHARRDWDKCLEAAKKDSAGREHKMCCDNCHTFVADALNYMEYLGFRHWNQVPLAAMVFFCGPCTTIPRTVFYVIPMVIVVLFVALLSQSP